MEDDTELLDSGIDLLTRGMQTEAYMLLMYDVQMRPEFNAEDTIRRMKMLAEFPSYAVPRPEGVLYLRNL